MVVTVPPSRQSMGRAVLAEKCRRSFAVFIQEFWHVIEPGIPLVWNWHVQAIADHLQAVTEGKFRRLMIAIPPGHGKSLFVSVFWQPWQWATNPSLRELYGSYDEMLTYRDSLRARDIIRSKKYQELFRPDWHIRHDQDSKGFFVNSMHGSRKTYYMGSRKKTGWRGDHIVIDDPLSAENRYDKNIKRAVIDSYDKVLSTRVNRMDRAAFVIIMQRLADDDLIGHILDSYGDEYVYLMLPSEYEPERRCLTPIFQDPRESKGELLFPQLFNRESIDHLKVQLGPVDADAQLQHRPHPEGGNRFESRYFQFWEWSGSSQIKIIHRSGAEEFHRVDLMPKFMVVDPACSENNSSDFTVIGLWAMTARSEIILLHRRKLQGGEPAVIEAVRQTFSMQDFGKIKPMFIGFEANGLGLPIIQGLRSGTPSLPVIDIHIHKDKFVMAAPAIVRIFGGQIFFPSFDTYDWVRDLTNFLVRFPGANHDDDVSMVSLAANAMYENMVPVIGKVQSMGDQKPAHNAAHNHFEVTDGRRPLFGAGKK